MAIYVDVLVAVNVLIDYFLLLATCRFMQLRGKRLRMVLASVFGGLCALVVLLPKMHMLLSLLMNLLFSVILLLIAFGRPPLRFFAKVLACFYGMSLLFSGVMTVLWFFVFPAGMVVNNGRVYFNISPLLLIVFTVVTYTIMRVIYALTGRHELKRRVYSLTVSVEGKDAPLQAMADTGNSLRDAMSHAPVLVAEYAAVEMLIPEEIRSIFRKKGDWQDIGAVERSAWRSRFHLIPFTAVYSNGFLPAFRADKIALTGKNGKQIDKSVYIAVCDQKLSLGNYNALFNPEILQ